MIAQLKSPQSQQSIPGYDLPPVPQTGTRVILLRHGRSTLNDAGRYQGSSDQSELTHGGITASQQVGQFLADCPIDAVFASPLRRAQATLSSLLPFLETRNKGVTTSPLLREIDLPEWEGQRYEDVRSQQPVAYRCWRETPDRLQMAWGCSESGGEGERGSRGEGEDGGEGEIFYPVRALYQRAERFWLDTLPRHRGQTLLVVSHGGTNQALINTAVGLPSCQHHALQQTHSGLSVLDFETPTLGQGHLHFLNLALGDRLPKLKAGKQGLRLLMLPCQIEVTPDPALATLLQGQKVQAAVVESWASPRASLECYPCHRMAQSVLKHNPETVVLSVQRSQFCQQWQAAIHRSLNTHSLKSHFHNELTTVLAIARPELFQGFLKTLLALPQNANALTLQTNTLTAVHYLSVQEHPILQGMNLSPWPFLYANHSY